MRTRSRCGRQSTICCLKALFVLLRTCLRYCVCYCLIRNYGRWPCFCEDQLHMINTGYRPDRYCQNLFMMWSLKNTYAVYEWFSIFEDRSANERSPNIKYMFTKSTEAANRDPECRNVFFRLAKLFVMSVALFKQILGEELVLSHFLVPGDEKKTIIKWKRPPFRRVAYSAPRDVCRCSICYGMTPIHYRGAKTTPKYGVVGFLPNFMIFLRCLYVHPWA